MVGPSSKKVGALGADLPTLGRHILRNGPVRTLHAVPRRIRVLFAGIYVADTTDALFVWEHPYYPYYYLPRASFAEGVLVSSPGSNSTGRSDEKEEEEDDDFAILTLQVNNSDGGDNNNKKRSTDRILHVTETSASRLEEKYGPGRGVLADMVRVEFGCVDGWFEEDTQIHVHPKDPFKRIDIVTCTSRPLRVLVEGVEVARTQTSFHLYETGLPCRFYLPPTSVVDWSVLRASETRTACPYKGVAEYYDVDLDIKREDGSKDNILMKDVVWWYRNPTIECASITGALCFYNERVDIELDGKLLDR